MKAFALTVPFLLLKIYLKSSMMGSLILLISIWFLGVMPESLTTVPANARFLGQFAFIFSIIEVLIVRQLTVNRISCLQCFFVALLVTHRGLRLKTVKKFRTNGIIYLFFIFWWLQHGPYECLLNTIEACAIDVWPDVVSPPIL